MPPEAIGTQETTDFEDEFARIAANKAGADPHTNDDEIGLGAADDATDATTSGKAEEASATDGENDAGQGKEALAGEDEQPFAGWPEHAVEEYNRQRQQIEQLQHRINSDDGRVSAFQRKVNQLNAELDQYRNKPQPTDEQIKEAMGGDDEGWKQFEEDFPEVAEAINKRFEAQERAAKQRIDESLAPVLEKQEENALSDAYDAVAEDFPTWQTEVNTDRFQNWFNDQPPGIQSLADSADTRDASTLIGMYDDYQVAHGEASIRKQSPDPGQQGGVKEKEQIDEVAARRAQQLEDGHSIPSKPAGVNTDQEATDGFEAAFNAFAARKEAQRQ